jgi:hypothetical protein
MMIFSFMAVESKFSFSVRHKSYFATGMAPVMLTAVLHISGGLGRAGGVAIDHAWMLPELMLKFKQA